MGRIPAVERDALTGGLTYESAMLWYYFLAEEADFEGDLDKCKEYLSKADSLGQFKGSLISSDLENAIKKFKGDFYVRAKI